MFIRVIKSVIKITTGKTTSSLSSIDCHNSEHMQGLGLTMCYKAFWLLEGS